MIISIYPIITNYGIRVFPLLRFFVFAATLPLTGNDGKQEHRHLPTV